MGVIQGALALRSHRDLFQWLQKDVQAFMPHDILVATWGDFESEQVCLDVVSALPGMRTTEVRTEELLALLIEMYEAWVDAGYSAFAMRLDSDIPCFLSADGGSAAVDTIGRMRSAVVHGIKDERGWHDCLYVALSGEPEAEAPTVEAIELLVPHIDAAFRKVTHLPMQREGLASIRPETSVPGVLTNGESMLSEREQEIMHWVSIGKTNPEIGLILCISPNTVRNHLQRIFRKLDVMNRAQAVFQFDQRVPARRGGAGEG